MTDARAMLEELASVEVTGATTGWVRAFAEAMRTPKDLSHLRGPFLSHMGRSSQTFVFAHFLSAVGGEELISADFLDVRYWPIADILGRSEFGSSQG